VAPTLGGLARAGVRWALEQVAAGKLFAIWDNDDA